VARAELAGPQRSSGNKHQVRNIAANLHDADPFRSDSEISMRSALLRDRIVVAD